MSCRRGQRQRGSLVKKMRVKAWRHLGWLLWFAAGVSLGQSERVVDAATAERLFRTHCSGCHGQQGEGGRGPVLATPKLVHASDEASLVTVITRGVPGTEMLPARMEQDQILGVAR